ncbi:MAG: FtsW/RodA/SpoVE family cell cycle protein [Candidatus Cloacimonadaceae bacterium]|nr:FtsW/RodA/SpoVE family cell cycle protein [Candidatus Cloacimonadota bacterium]MCB5255744.1 FtsW/RodA/SpoVE family cell cycle protein [Candidatus Cloacimonadota bacterium]MCK9177863.1 FtsW/RodA/SpoVE family cell cycle protein [Candidatus Cloacimonadota bacterium]MCK9242064.1 FtsW/RodA/SpoVE family cell cycle protein [Candidatus Cloacimonadota bacterium]MDY0127412.1 FtsW/RodA/SpoVE family cell cycle protein [Candidatus Cloacimonadaceae bacterium]
MKKNRLSTYVVNFDRLILFSYLALCLIGLIVMVDITSVQSSMEYFYKQLGFTVFSGFIAIVILYAFKLEKLRFTNTWLVYIAIIMLVYVLVKGASIKGATRQISLGPLNFQPSFFARIALVFFFASVLDKKNELLRQTKNILRFPENFPALTLLTIGVFVLILIEKHLSTIIISGMTLLGMLFYAGIRKRILIIMLAIGMIAGVLIITQGDSFRMQRMRAFKKYSLFFPERDLSNTGDGDYQVRESLTALTSGGILGTGIARGRAKHYYLPEARTDYVYTIIGEETGYVGAMVVFLLHCTLFFASMRVAERQESLYLKLLAAGMAMNIFCNVLVNTGVAMSILPPTGNTLPFISYGGSALLMDSIAVGVILNISARRREL